jgi:hypothetical protein
MSAPPDTVHVTALTGDTLINAKAGEQVYVRDRSGDVVHEARITEVRTKPVTFRSDNIEITTYEVHYRTIYGSQSQCTLVPHLDSAAFLDEKQRRSGDGYMIQHDPTLARIVIPTDTGGIDVPVMATYGSALYLSVIVPDVTPDEVRDEVLAMLTQRYPTLITNRAQSRPVADERVDVLVTEFDYSNGGRPTDRVVAVNVLSAQIDSFMARHGSVSVRPHVPVDDGGIVYGPPARTKP